MKGHAEHAAVYITLQSMMIYLAIQSEPSFCRNKQIDEWKHEHMHVIRNPKVAIGSIEWI